MGQHSACWFFRRNLSCIEGPKSERSFAANEYHYSCNRNYAGHICAGLAAVFPKWRICLRGQFVDSKQGCRIRERNFQLFFNPISDLCHRSLRKRFSKQGNWYGSVSYSPEIGH